MRSTITILQHVLFLLLALAMPPGVVQTASGQESGASSDVRFSLLPTSRLGLFTFVAGQWGEFSVRLENRGNTSKDLLCSSHFSDDDNLQFGRKVWLPAHSRLVLPHPVMFPETDQFSNGSALVRSLVFDDSQGNDVVVKSASGRVKHERTFLVTQTGRNTGIIAGWDSEDVVSPEVRSLIVASRVNQDLNNKVTVLAGHFLAADEVSLHYLDHMVLAENKLVDDLAALTAVRRWLHAGGHLWIMLDRTDPVILERLFGDTFQGSIVDRIGLTSVRVDKAPSVFAPESKPGETRFYEEPVEMARAVLPGMKVWNTVNGWPAALTTTYGQGRVLITTLGARGWMVKPPPTDLREDQQVEYSATTPMSDLSAWIFSERKPNVLPPDSLKSFPKEYVSYNVPTWARVVGMMGGFLALLVAMGGGLWWSQRLDHFAWSGSLLAVIFSILFLGMGLKNRQQTPETSASVLFAQVVDGTDDVRTHGAVAVYRSEGSQSLIQTSMGGDFWPDELAADNSLRRMVTTDLGAFHWDGLSQSANVLGAYSVATSGTSTDRIAARATIDAQGISGEYSGAAFVAADAILATRKGRVGIHLQPDGQFSAAADDVLKEDQYLNATLLNDVQDRRRRILQRLFSNRNWQDSLGHPHLLLWMKGWEHGVQFGEGLQRQGDTLLSVPLELIRPSAGTEMLIPSPLLSFANRRSPDISGPSGCWDDGRQEWQERTNPSSTWLNFQLPKELLPLQATKAQININVSGLMGTIEILGIRNGEAIGLQTVTDPVGSMSFEINDPGVLNVSQNGELAIGINAGFLAQSASIDTSQQTASRLETRTLATSYIINSLSLQLWAIASEIHEEN
jgi:hypothetical protein